MQDLIGHTLGHYRIVEQIGAGGMGVVYRAQDERLDRDVAIKVLPEAVAQDAERLARFEREAKLLASLSHQNIATLYGLEEHEGQRFLVMELVEGESLAGVHARGAVPVDEALPIALQIAEGLEAAHEQGIIHRDLKPGNVMLSPEGQVKVLDFGLAKASRPDENNADLTRSPTLTAQMTAAGVLLGTAAYMSPEQARGKPVDKKADVWAFGVLLFEMLTGARLLTGNLKVPGTALQNYDVHGSSLAACEVMLVSERAPSEDHFAVRFHRLPKVINKGLRQLLVGERQQPTANSGVDVVGPSFLEGPASSWHPFLRHESNKSAKQCLHL